ncbi:MAG TPA: hypothetical protein VG406_12685 [Isosphaeraceae bacterium]|nr:hypothetical protein [Isosphaeraceae bacterium]
MPPYSDLFRWPVGAARPEVVLCVARDNDKHYKIYKYNNEVELARYRPTGWNFGGFMRPPTPAEQRKARWRAEHAGRWLAWTRGFGEPVGVGETREMALAEAARAGYGDVVCEWVPPGPAAGEAAIS